MHFEEYKPSKGWLNYHRRKAVIDKVRTAALCFALVAMYVAVGTLESL